MEGSASSINSRATAIKTILLAAWRDKLSQEEWAARIKKVLPKGVNGDVYDLADCLLKQALVGPAPSRLFIDYLKYAVKCELVSHGAVLSSIANQPIDIRLSNLAPSRTSPIICLVEFLRTFRDKISCKGTEIECLNLCNSLGQLINWLLKCVQISVDCLLESIQLSQNQHQLSSQQHQSQNSSMPSSNSHFPSQPQKSLLKTVDLCLETILFFIDRPFTKSLLFISKIDNCRNFDGISKTLQAIKQKLASCPIAQLIQDNLQYFKALNQMDLTFNSNDMHPSVVAAQQLRCVQMHRIRSTQVSTNCNFERKYQQTPLVHDSTTNYALFNSLYPSVAFDVVLRPARPLKMLAHQIATITNFNSAPTHTTYCELIRVCMIGLIDTEGTILKVKWAFFTFLKMPKLLLKLSKVFDNNRIDGCNGNNLNPSAPLMNSESEAPSYVSNFINDLKLAFERLCQYSPLLDEAECKCNCDLFKFIVRELIKHDPNLKQLKNVELRKFPSKYSVPNNSEGSLGECMLRAKSVVTTFSETLDSNQDPVEFFNFLGKLVTGIQFEFSLSAAASTGKLDLFIEKLVEHNEANKNPRLDATTKNSQIQALIFDITFLILTYVAQQYGPEVIATGQQSTFNIWYNNSYNPSTRINCPKEMLKNSDNSIVSSLIKQLLHPNDNIQMNSINWLDVCRNLPKAIDEIITAWNQDQLTEQQIRTVIERIKSKMCSLAVIAATWLQCYIRTLNESDRAKPLFFLQCLTKASHHAKQHSKQVAASESGLESERYSERSSLMCSIIKKIYFEIVPKTTSNTATSGQSNANSASSTNSSSNIVNAAGRQSSNSAQVGNGDPQSLDDSQDESAFRSINDRFLSTSTTQEIFLVNVKHCLSRGYIDHKSLVSLSSLFKMIGSQCFTNLIVEQILTSHESPKDLSRAVNITFGLFHLDIDACAFALLNETIPSWLMGEKKQTLLNQPRAFALAHLAVMTVIGVFNNITNVGEGGATSRNDLENTKSISNGIIKIEPGLSANDQQSASINGPREAKRVKLSHDTNDKGRFGALQRKSKERLDRLNNCVADLMRLFKEIMSDPVMSQRSLFPILFLQQTVVCTREKSSVITAHLQPEILLDIINLFSSELTFELVLAISNLSSTSSRKFAAKAMCKLAQVQEAKQNRASSSSSPPSGSLDFGRSTPGGQGSIDGLGGSNANSSSRSISGSGTTPMIIG